MLIQAVTAQRTNALGAFESKDVEIDVYVASAPHITRSAICVDVGTGSGQVFLDENHAQALVLALQAAIAEVQARAVSL